MEKEYIQVSFENENIERKSYPAGIRLLDLAKEYQKEDDIVLAKVNGRLRELYLQLTEDCRISFITTRQQHHRNSSALIQRLSFLNFLLTRKQAYRFMTRLWSLW